MKAVIFDLDDTLYPERQFVLSGFRAVATRVLQKYGVQGFFESQKALFDAGRRKKIFDTALALCGLPAEPAVLVDLLQVYRFHSPQIELFSDANQVLQCCRRRYKTGLITDGYAATQRNKVQALKLTERLDAFVFSDDFGRENWKPSAAPYQEMCRLLQVAPEHCVYIGDNPEKDFITAKKLAWTTIRVRRPGTENEKIIAQQEYDANFTVPNLEECFRLLSQLDGLRQG